MILYWINVSYWAQDALSNVFYRRTSTSSRQAFFSYAMLLFSLLFALVIHTPTPSFLTSWTALIKPTAVVVLIALVFLQGIISTSRFIHAHSDFSPFVKPASWAFLYGLFIPAVIAFILVPAVSSLSDVIYNFQHPWISAFWKVIGFGHTGAHSTRTASTAHSK